MPKRKAEDDVQATDAAKKAKSDNSFENSDSKAPKKPKRAPTPLFKTPLQSYEWLRKLAVDATQAVATKDLHKVLINQYFVSSYKGPERVGKSFEAKKRLEARLHNAIKRPVDPVVVYVAKPIRRSTFGFPNRPPAQTAAQSREETRAVDAAYHSKTQMGSVLETVSDAAAGYFYPGDVARPTSRTRTYLESAGKKEGLMYEPLRGDDKKNVVSSALLSSLKEKGVKNVEDLKAKVSESDRKLISSAKVLLGVQHSARIGSLILPIHKPKPHETWSVRHVALFEAAVLQYGKEFHRIAELVNKPTTDVVDFYYAWKKTPRYERFKRDFKKFGH